MWSSKVQYRSVLNGLSAESYFYYYSLPPYIFRSLPIILPPPKSSHQIYVCIACLPHPSDVSG